MGTRMTQRERTAWDVAWLAWILMFFVIEIPAVRNDEEGDTLSEHIARWFRVDTVRGKSVWTAVWGAFGAWMSWHIVSYQDRDYSGDGS